MAAFPLMPKATAAWLVDNTALTFDQIAEFCGLHPLEIQALADGEVNTGIMGTNPVINGELTPEEIARCEKNVNAKLKMQKTDLPKPRARSKGPRYTPVTKRAEKPNAVAYLLKKHPELADVQIAKLIGSTKPTVDAIRNKTHPQSSTLKPADPVSLGLCTADELDKAVRRAQRRIEREAKAAGKPATPAQNNGAPFGGVQPITGIDDEDLDDEETDETPDSNKAAEG
ncbi:MAG: cell cycle transcriptional regulator TrcR [Alphaproteobacteria bacterium]